MRIWWSKVSGIQSTHACQGIAYKWHLWQMAGSSRYSCSNLGLHILHTPIAHNAWSILLSKTKSDAAFALVLEQKAKGPRHVHWGQALLADEAQQNITAKRTAVMLIGSSCGPVQSHLHTSARTRHHDSAVATLPQCCSVAM
jgi:hypothetical protein